MGQSQTLALNQPVTFQQVQNAIKIIFDDQQTKFQPINIAISVQQILQNLSQNIPAQKTEEGFLLNHKMIQIFYHKGFLFAIGKLINLLIDKLQEIGQKTLVMVQRDEWQFCLNLANFIAFFTDDKLIRMMETVNIRSDLSENTKKYINNLEKEGNEFGATQSLIDKLSFSEIERIEKCLRISMNQMIGMRTQVITRSQRTLKIIEKLEQACFILYLKALYSPQHTQSIVNKAKHPQFLKSNLTIAHYFLGKGCDSLTPSIYQSAVLFLSNLIQKNRQNLKQYKSLPTHLFKTLPIVSNNTIYDFVMNICLYSLTYLKDGSGNMYSRFVFNRIMTLKLLDLIVKEVKVTSQQITYYLEEICLQTRIGMIQRSFVTDLVQHYMDLVNESVAETSNIQQSKARSQVSIQPSLPASLPPQFQPPKFTRQHKLSQILTKYLEGGKQNYNIKFSNKKYKITTSDIVTELQNDETIIQTEFRILCEKYIYEVVLGKRVMYQYSDRQIWSEILPNIIEDKADSSGDEKDELREETNQKQYKLQMKKEQNNIHSKNHSSSNEQISPPRELKPETIKISKSFPEKTPIDQLKHNSQENEPSPEEEFQDALDHENHEQKEQPIETFE